jgi:mannonate dehydratase
MIHSMRWFGPNDPVSLNDIRQAGCQGIITALHQIPVGDVWTTEAISERIKIIEAQNHELTPLKWLVVESLPVHEAIKKNTSEADFYIQNYIVSLQNLAALGIKTVCYNFMPVLDWSRTTLSYTLPNGAKALRFEWLHFALFDLYILERPEAHLAYSQDIKTKAKALFDTAEPAFLKELQNTVLLGLPGSNEAFELATFQGLLDEYKNINADTLRNNLVNFLRKITPEAEKLGVKLCIHPDDPPFPLLGLPRVVSSAADLDFLFSNCPSMSNGLTFCTGSLGVRADNHLVEMFKNYAERVYFFHLRATKRLEMQNDTLPSIFFEANHLEGDFDMVKLIQEIVKEEDHRKQEIPMRPDHGHQMLDDLHKTTYPGYSAIGRLKGLAEIRGVELALRKML